MEPSEDWGRHHRPNAQDEAPSTADAWADLDQRFPAILLVGDDPSLQHSLQRLLTRLGHQVEVCGSAERAITLCTEMHFDLVLMDHNLGHGNLDGTQAAQRLRHLRPELPLVIVTGINWLVRHHNVKAEARAARARGALIKPVEFGRLQQALTAIAAGQDDWDEMPLPNLPAAGLEPLDGRLPGYDDLLRLIHEKLSELRHETKADSCVLFHMNIATRQVSVFAHNGVPLSNYDGSKYTLQASSIDQVIRQGETLYEPDTTLNSQQFQHLDLLPFASCIGLPVKGFRSCEYGLFLFHPGQGHFTWDHLRQAATVAESIAALMARKEAERVIQQMQPFVFAGQLGAHLVHELNNRLSSVLNDAKTLELEHQVIEQFQSTATADPCNVLSQRIHKMQDCIRSLQQNGRAMHKIMRLYLGMVSPEQREAVNLNDVIQRAVNILAPIAEGYGVRVLTDLETQLPATFAVGVRVEQVLVNVALNAIQHTHWAGGGGDIFVQSRFTSQNSRLPIQLRIADTGPGIHHQHLGCIFDLGFSTRREGNGFGLFISRGLIESMGGRISVEKSVMMKGTTFLIELPLVLPCVEGDLL